MSEFSSDKLAYSIKDACKATSLGRTTLYSHIAAGRIRAVRIGGRTVILRDDLARFLASLPDFCSAQKLEQNHLTLR